MKDRKSMVSFQTGDINLAAALMACGVPPSPENPVTLIQPENGKRYGSFRLLGVTMDGKDNTEDLMAVWAGNKVIEPSHPFDQICRFLRARPNNCRDTEGMLEFAFDYLRDLGFPVLNVRHMGDVPKFVESRPQSVDAFILAFIHCRELLFQLFHRAKTEFYMTRGQGIDARHALISSDLPAWMRNELTSRLQG